MTASTSPRLATAWFEIPTRDLDRAQRFYETVLERPLAREAMGPHQLAVFPYDEPATGGCLMTGGDAQPAAAGTVVYLDASPSLDAAIARVAGAGGTVTVPRTPLPGDMGAFAVIADPDGNRVGLHARG